MTRLTGSLDYTRNEIALHLSAIWCPVRNGILSENLKTV
jgi:hypothetical protein